MFIQEQKHIHPVVLRPLCPTLSHLGLTILYAAICPDENLLFKHELAKNRHCYNCCLIPGLPFPRSAADVTNSQQTHLQRYSQFHFNLMPQSCGHFNVSHDSFLLKRKDTYEEICCKIAYSFYRV